MVLDIALPSKVVIASHLFRRSNAHIAPYLIALHDIDDYRNGLLLFKPLEYAYDRFQISFIYDKNLDQYLLKVMDPSFLEKRLVELLTSQQMNILSAEIPMSTAPSVITNHGVSRNLYTITFGDLQDCAIAFRGISRPFNRCLNLQARLARYKAIRDGWVKKEYDFEDFWSEQVQLTETMDRYFSTLSNATESSNEDQ